MMMAGLHKVADKHVERQIRYVQGDAETISFPEGQFDAAMVGFGIRNVTNMKDGFREMYRVLKPGGRLAISDVVATAPLPDEIQQDLALLSACIGGAATIDDTVKMLEKAGFQDIEIIPKAESHKLISEWVPKKGRNAGDHVVSAYIKALKPL